MEDPPAPSDLLRTILYHISGAIPQLRSYADEGPTLYALTVFGVKPGTMGAATLAGPAIDAGGLGGWPADAAALARAAFARPGLSPEQSLAQLRRRAGAVVVFVTLQAGCVSHRVAVGLPSARPRAERRAPAPAPPRQPAPACAGQGSATAVGG